MKIAAIAYTTANRDAIRITLRDGRAVHAAWPLGDRLAAGINAWLAVPGNAVGDYAPPPAPTKDDRIAGVIGNNEVLTAFVKALAKQLNITPARLVNAIKAEMT